MSQQARQNLAPSSADNKGISDAKRKMTQAILEDETKKKDNYEFLADDDDFEEFELNNEGNIDVEMQEDADKKQW